MVKKLLVVMVSVLLISSVSFAYNQCNAGDETCGSAVNFGAGAAAFDPATLPAGALAQIQAYYYSLNCCATNGSLPHNWNYDRSAWMFDGFGAWQILAPLGQATACACPVLGNLDEVIAIVAYDSNPADASGLVSYAMVGVPYTAPSFNLDMVNDGMPTVWSTYPCPGNCTPYMQPIPVVGVSSIDATGGNTVAVLTFGDPGQPSFGIAPHTEYMYGYRIYYSTTPWDGSSPMTPAANNETYGGVWTAVDVNDLAALGSGGATVTITGDVVLGNTLYFALAVVGTDNGGGPTYMETGYVGEASTGYGQSPAAIELLSFGASSGLNKAVVSWETGSEVDTAGFNIYRASGDNGRRVKINDSLIPSQGGPASGATYELVDTRVHAGEKYFYLLEEVETNNNRNSFGPVSTIIKGGITQRLGN